MPLFSQTLIFIFFRLDVGGGSVVNGARYSLARIPLRWMIRECYKANTGIKFNEELLPKVGIDPLTLYGVVPARPISLDVESNRIQKPPAISICRSIRALFRHCDNTKDPQSDESSFSFSTEEEEELHDAISPKYDQLRRQKGWWIVEILPLPQVKQPGLHGAWVRHCWYV